MSRPPAAHTSILCNLCNQGLFQLPGRPIFYLCPFLSFISFYGMTHSGQPPKIVLFVSAFAVVYIISYSSLPSFPLFPRLFHHIMYYILYIDISSHLFVPLPSHIYNNNYTLYIYISRIDSLLFLFLFLLNAHCVIHSWLLFLCCTQGISIKCHRMLITLLLYVIHSFVLLLYHQHAASPIHFCYLYEFSIIHILCLLLSKRVSITTPHTVIARIQALHAASHLYIYLMNSIYAISYDFNSWRNYIYPRYIYIWDSLVSIDTNRVQT